MSDNLLIFSSELPHLQIVLSANPFQFATLLLIQNFLEASPPYAPLGSFLLIQPSTYLAFAAGCSSQALNSIHSDLQSIPQIGDPASLIYINTHNLSIYMHDAYVNEIGRNCGWIVKVFKR